MSAVTRYAHRAGGYLREAPGGVNLEKVATYAALALAVYVVWKIYRAGKAVTKAAGAAAEAAGEKVANVLEWIRPFDIGDMLYFAVKFPDGSTHSVGSRQVDSNGYFTFTPAASYKGNPAYAGKRFRLAIDRNVKTGTNKYAIAA